ncbi:hypothetical protein H5410_051521 [Solanum commersonii]|uniref:Putative plant transposon protein domain-containing protein n=1 Tax=Solanum commersonii TaxID=4109 RepID=A0A9J5X0Y2_SOLCO|nr:hypothetical protein H5410_051521 [Solanum commersonii]
MAPKAENVAGSKRSRMGKASGSGNREPTQKFRKKAVKAYGLLWFDCQQEPKYMGDKYVDEVRLQTQILAMYRTVVELGLKFIFDHSNDCNLTLLLGIPNCDADEFNRLKETPPYRDIRHTLCGVESTAIWGRNKDIGRHNTLQFANFILVSRVWLKIVCSVLLPAKHLPEATMDRVVLVYMLMKGMPINVGAILRQHMMKFRNNMRWWFCYGGTKALDISHGLVLSSQERQTRDDSVMARMFGMAEFATFLCKTGPAFSEPLNDDEATADEAMDDDEEDYAIEGEACRNWLTVEAPRPGRSMQAVFARPKSSEGCRWRSQARRQA